MSKCLGKSYPLLRVHTCPPRPSVVCSGSREPKYNPPCPLGEGAGGVGDVAVTFSFDLNPISARVPGLLLRLLLHNRHFHRGACESHHSRSFGSFSASVTFEHAIEPARRIARIGVNECEPV